MSHGHSHSHGGGHSHDEGEPDDTWNLYQHIDRAEGLNGEVVGGGEGVVVSWAPEGSSGKARCVFKPHARRLQPAPALRSDADEQLIVKVAFVAPVSVRRIMVVGAGPAEQHPSSVRVFTGAAAEALDFDNAETTAPAQAEALAPNPAGEGYFNCVRQPFTNIMAIAFFFPMPPAHSAAETTRRRRTAAHLHQPKLARAVVTFLSPPRGAGGLRERNNAFGFCPLITNGRSPKI